MLTQISASAGSGKTYTLTRHFLELLRLASPLPCATGCALHGRNFGYSPEEILAATFTNKAAAEMKTRVVSGLKEEALLARAARQSAAQGQAELWVERILRHYGSLNIRTIDSLLSTLVRLSALELELPPDFELSFSPEEYFTPVYDALMDELAPDEEQLALLQGRALPERTDPDTEGNEYSTRRALTKSAAATLRARLAKACRTLLEHGNFKGFTPKGRLHNLLLELVLRLLRGEETPQTDSGRVHERINILHADMRETCFALLRRMEAEELAVAKNFLRYLDACTLTAPYAAPPDSVYRYKTGLDECLNKASRGKASHEAETAFTLALAAVEAYCSSLPLFLQALQLAPLSDLAHEIFTRMRQSMSNLLPAPCLPVMAGELLSGQSGVSDALCRLGARLSRLLLDEFQDTSREQWRAILPLAVESLSTGGSLTLVGDVKQAIYGWRGGDSRLFHEAVSEPELLAICPRATLCELEYNWRSHPVLIAHNNAFFSLLGREDIALDVLSAMLPHHTPEHYRIEAAREAAANYAGSAQRIPPEKDWDADPKSGLATVRLYRVKGQSGPHMQEAIRERLERLLREELLPNWRYGDIAILVRAGDEAALAAGWLSSLGIPVVTENSFLLATHPLIARLVSFLSFLDYPLDDLAFWEFAGGEECFGRENRADAETWLADSFARGRNSGQPLYLLFRKDFPAIWQSRIEPFYSGAGLMSAYDTLLEAVKRFEILKRSPEQAPFVRRLLELAHLAESRGHSSLASFLSFWRSCKDDEKLPLPEQMDAVRIMTIHKAKGLEFPVVILPFQYRGRRRDAELTSATIRGVPLLTRAGRELPERYYPACITDELERLNLLYVAWTRPVYALHAFITPPAGPGTSTPLTRALEQLVGHYERETAGGLCQWETLGQEGGDESAPFYAEPLEDETEPLESRREPPKDEAVLGETGPDRAANAPYDAYRNDFAQDFDDRSGGPFAPDAAWRPMDWLPRLKIYRSPLPAPHFTPRQRGILAHLCLEHLILSGPEVEAARKEDVERAVRQGIRLFPLPLEDPERVAAEMAEGLAWFCSLPEAPLWLARGKREQDIMDEHGRMHRVDLLVSKSDGGMHAVDYKTGQAREEHHQQVLRYMRLAAKATGRPVRGFLVYLDEQRLIEVREHGGER